MKRAFQFLVLSFALISFRLNSAEAPSIYGIHDHDPSPQEFLNHIETGNTRGWVTATVGVGANTNDSSGANFTAISSRGHTVICRINYGYYPEGTIPLPAKWDDFAIRCARFVTNTTGCNIWLIGNELNLAAEWPWDGTQFVYISPQDYATCFRKVYNAIKAVRPNDKVLPQPCAPWAGPYGSGFQNVNGTNYPHAAMPITWTQYEHDMLTAIQASGGVDGIALHIGSRGYTYSDIHSTNKFGGLDLYSSFYAYKDWIDYGIPQSLYHLPLYATECNGMYFWKGGHPEDPSKHYEAGWMQEIFAEINRYNQLAANSGRPIFRCVNFYRWCGFCDGWNIDGASNPYKAQILSDLDAAIGQTYLWPTNIAATNAPATPTNLTAVASAGKISLSWSPVPFATAYNVKYDLGTSPSGNFSTIATVTGTNFVHTGFSTSLNNYYVVSATNSFGESTNSSRIAVVNPNGLPDVVVTAISWTPSNSFSGNNVIFKATVKNQGSAPTPAGTTIGVGFLVDGNQVAWSANFSSSLAVGATTTLTASGGPNGVDYWSATSGPHAVVANVDDINRFPEGNENNNISTTNLLVFASGYAVNCGSTNVSRFDTDAYFSGSTDTFSVTNSIDTSSLFAPAPQAVYQSERWNDSTYTFPNLVAGYPYTVRLHFAEISPSVISSGDRRFHVAINRTQVLTNFDIFAEAGGKYRGVIREFTTVGSGSNNVVVQFIQGASNEPKVSAIEVVPGLPPILNPIPDKSVAEGSNIVFAILAANPDPGQLITDFENFSTFPSPNVPMFQPPTFSATTSTNIDSNYSYGVLTNNTATNIHGGGKVFWMSCSFLNTSNPWLRFTTFNASSLPNPTVDFSQSLRFDLYTTRDLKLAVGLRETGTSTNIGANGGTIGSIEFAGATGINGIAPVPLRTIPASNWVTLTFNLTNESLVAFAGSGNGILQSATGKGVLEHLALVPNSPGSTSIYLDNFAVVPNCTLAYSLVAAPTGANINPTNGVFTWIPTEDQGPGTYPITVRVAKNGTLSATKTFLVTVNEVNQAPMLAGISDKTVNAGATLFLTNSATDVDLPANALKFSLDPDAPTGAEISSNTGVFTWATSLVSSTTTNAITVRVSDDGTPTLSSAKTFNVIRIAPPRIASAALKNNNLELNWQTFPGKTYRLETKSDLNEFNWTVLSDVVAGGSTLSFTNTLTGDQKQFYRVIQVD